MRSIMPRGPGVAAVMHPEILDPGTPCGALEGRPVFAARRQIIVPAWPPVWLALGPGGQAAGLWRGCVRGCRQGARRALEDAAAPVEPQRLAGPGAGVQQEHDKRLKMGRAGGNEPRSLVRG